VGVRKTGTEGDLELRRNSNKRLEKKKENFIMTTSWFVTKYYWVNQIKEDEVGGARMLLGEKTNA
jgi:hypothetical protein